MLANYTLWSSNHFSTCNCFLYFSWSMIFIVQICQGSGFSGSKFFRVQVFQGPGISGSSFFWVQDFQGPGFSVSGSRVWVQGPGPGFRSSLIIYLEQRFLKYKLKFKYYGMRTRSKSRLLILNDSREEYLHIYSFKLLIIVTLSSKVTYFFRHRAIFKI